MFAKKIVDIQIKNGLISVERELGISSFEVEKQIENYHYSGTGLIKDNSVENAKLPPFIVPFYYFIFTQRKIPSQKELIETYYSISNFKILDESVEIDDKKVLKKSIDARLLRSFPSLVRDFHFYLILFESKIFDAVDYSLKMDYINGLDIKITHQNKVFYVSLHISTSRGKSFKIKKKKRHDYANKDEFVIEANFAELKKVGEFYLYHSKNLENLKNDLTSFNN